MLKDIDFGQNFGGDGIMTGLATLVPRDLSRRVFKMELLTLTFDLGWLLISLLYWFRGGSKKEEKRRNI